MIHAGRAFIFFLSLERCLSIPLVFLVVKIDKQEFEFFLALSYERHEKSRLNCKL